MASSERMSGPVLTNLSSATLFAGTDELERMKSLRLKISEVRRIWQNLNLFNSLKDKIKSYINHEQLSPKTLSRVDTLLKGYTDWADMDYHRPSSQMQRFTAIELYCSKEGYNLLFGIFNAVLREKDTDDETLLVAAGLVELVTIELYNLRLSNIGNPRYSNYEGVTYRGMGVSTEMAEAYRKAAQHPELARRHFAVPLGFTSSSTSEETMKEFVKQYPEQEQMLWTIHIHGLEASLVKKYEERYPDSVVTSISAMPVGRIAELREKEILLRGAFFHIVGMESKEEEEGRWVHRLVLVVMNTNRDHGTELALDEGGKQEQRNFFRDVVLASRFKICAELAKDMGNGDGEGYEELMRKALERIDVMSELSKDFGNLRLQCPREVKVVTWHGDITDNYLPSNYLALRRSFHIATEEGNWNVVRDIIAGEYEWEMTDWFHVTALKGPYRGRTLLHYMATSGPPQQNSEQEKGWLYLLGRLDEREVWSMISYIFLASAWSITMKFRDITNK